MTNGPGTQPTGTPPAGGVKPSGLAPNIASLLCYLCMPITGIVFLVIEKENKDVKFHAWQATIFGVAYIVLLIVLQILTAIMGAIAGFLGALFGILIPVVAVGVFVLWIICLIKAYQGERWKIPFLGEFAAKKAGV